MKDFESFFASLPAGNVERGRLFAEFCVQQLPSRPEFDVDEIWLWDDWPHRWGADNGIDFVFTDKAGRLWAGQAKCHVAENRVSKSEMDSFTAESSTGIPTLKRTFDRRILITSGQGLGRNSERLFSRENHAPLTLITREDLVEWGRKETAELSSGRKIPLEHQKLAIAAVTNGFLSSDKGQLLMACGTGKTLTGLWIQEALEPELCVVAVPSLGLIRQTMQVWNEESASKLRIIALCSDSTVSPEDDSLTDNILEMPFPVTTDPDELRQLLARGGKTVVLTTYASFPVLGEVLKELGLKADLTIADEAHRTTGDRKGRDKAIHNKELYESRKTLFMTATPRVYADKRDQSGEDVVLSMDDPKVFGPVFFEISFADAINKWNLLVDFEVHCLVVEDSNLFENLGLGRKTEVDGTTQTLFDAAISDIFARFCESNSLHRVITYHSRKARAQSFQTTLNSRQADRMSGYFVSGDMNTFQRSRVLRNLELGGKSTVVVSNARCLTEGIDIPTLDGIAFIDPRYSTTDIVQAIGRVIRRAPGKDVGKILVPLVTNSSGEVSNESFRGMWRVIKALESHDIRLVDEIASLSYSSGKSGRKWQLPNKVHYFGLEEYSASVADKITTEISRETGDGFRYNLGILVDFYEKNSRGPKRDEEYRGLFVERWQSKQRANFNAGTLSVERISAIENAFPPDVWSWDPQLEYDLKMADHLEEFVIERRQGRFIPFIRIHRVRGKSVCQHGIDVGTWWFSKGRVNAGYGLNPRLKERLNRIEGLTLDNPNPLNFEYYAKELEKYLNENGKPPPEDYVVPVPGYAPQNGLRLGQWLGNLRGQKRRGILASANASRVEGIPGFTWEVARGNWRGTQSQNDVDWQAKLNNVKHYVALNSKLPPYSKIDPTTGKSKTLSEGIWLARQKRNYFRLNDARQKALRELPGFQVPSSD